MLRVAIRRVINGRADELRGWCAEVAGPRRQEALATLDAEGCTHEQAYLIEGAGDTVLVYVMEVDDIDASQAAARASEHPIDADHQRVMERVLGEPLAAELLLDLHR
jgi:Family of unknown function (DUF6176)